MGSQIEIDFLQILKPVNPQGWWDDVVRSIAKILAETLETLQDAGFVHQDWKVWPVT